MYTELQMNITIFCRKTSEKRVIIGKIIQKNVSARRNKEYNLVKLCTDENICALLQYRHNLDTVRTYMIL